LAFVYLFAAFGAFFLSLELHRKLDHESRRRLLEIFGFGIAILGATMAIMNYGGNKNPLTPEAHVFTFLQNRNLCALLCAAGGVVCFALAYDRILRHPWQGALLLVAAFGCLAGTLSLLSRASLALFFLGCVLWVLFSTHQHELRKRLKVIVPVGTLLVAGVFVFGQHTVFRLMRMVLNEGLSETPINRVDIWRDALACVPSTWLTGSGWGTFHAVVGVFRSASLSVNSLSHPENDYLWLLIEGGLPMVVGFALLTFGIWRMRGRSQARMEGSGRLVTVLAVLFCLQAMVDTPLHSPTLMLFACWLIGMWASPAEDNARPKALWISSRGWRLGGALLMAGGLVLGIGVATAQPWFNSTAKRGSLALLRGETTETSSIDEPDEWLGRANLLYPLEWTVHSARGRQEMVRGDFRAAQTSFRRARLVCQDMGEVTWNESLFWRRYGAVTQTLDAWRETFLERRMYDDAEKFRAIIRAASGNPLLIEGVAVISRPQSRLRALFFEVGNPLTAVELERELERNPTFVPWDRDRRRSLYWSVGRILGWERLARHFEQHEVLKEDFPYLFEIAREESEDWARDGRVLAEIIPPPPLNSYGSRYSLEELRALARRSPGDAAIVSALIREEAKVDGWAELLETLEAFRVERRVAEPRSFHYWRAFALTKLERGREAGEAWKDYLAEWESRQGD
jgi:hypothetical protein